MKILVVGKGGREHALVQSLSESDSHPDLYCFPGSDAISQLAAPVDASDLPSLMAFVEREAIDLVVGGEESYLVLGLADECRSRNIPCWGPPKAAAMLEGSKEFAKEFMVKHGIPTGGYTPVETVEAAKAAITSYPCVLKFDGLAAGKGVAVCPDESAVDDFLDTVFTQKKFGEGRLLVEEFLTGPEISIFCCVSGPQYQILTPARDYKRLGDNDEGPNTGGMGAVASPSLLGTELLQTIEETIVRPTIDGLEKDDLSYIGFLYFGLMLTPDGPKIIEYNCRFGDPECQAVMPLVSGEFAGYLDAGARGEIKPDLIRLGDGWSICLVQASAGYPASSRSGDVISGLDDVSNGARVYHAGTKRNEQGQFETNGGRVLAVVAGGDTREAALEAAYAEASKVTFDGAQSRSDVGRLHF